MIYDSISRMTLSMFKLDSFVQAQRARSQVQFNLNTLCAKGVSFFFGILWQKIIIILLKVTW